MKLKRSRLGARCQQRFFNPLSSDAVGVSGFAMEFGLAVEFGSSSLAVAVAELDHERVSAAAGGICKPQFWFRRPTLKVTARHKQHDASLP